MPAYRTTPAREAIQRLVDEKAAAVLTAVELEHADGALIPVYRDILPGVYLGDGTDGWAINRLDNIQRALDHADRWLDDTAQMVLEDGAHPSGDLTAYGEFMAGRDRSEAVDEAHHLARLWILVTEAAA